MKTAKDYLQEANEVVKKIDVKEAIEKQEPIRGRVPACP